MRALGPYQGDSRLRKAPALQALCPQQCDCVAEDAIIFCPLGAQDQAEGNAQAFPPKSAHRVAQFLPACSAGPETPIAATGPAETPLFLFVTGSSCPACGFWIEAGQDALTPNIPVDGHAKPFPTGQAEDARPRFVSHFDAWPVMG